VTDIIKWIAEFQRNNGGMKSTVFELCAYIHAPFIYSNLC